MRLFVSSGVVSVSLSAFGSLFSSPARATPPSGYVEASTGYIWASCVHQVPSGAVVADDGSVSDSSGRLLFTMPPCPHPFIPYSTTAASGEPPSSAGGGGTTGGGSGGESTGGGVSPDDGTCGSDCNSTCFSPYSGWIENAAMVAPPGGFVTEVYG